MRRPPLAAEVIESTALRADRSWRYADCFVVGRGRSVVNVKVHHHAVVPSVRAIEQLLDETVEEAQTVPYSSHVHRLIDDVEGEDVEDDAITEYGARQAGSDYAIVALLRPPALPQSRLVDEETTGPTEVFAQAKVEQRSAPPAPPKRPPHSTADDSEPELPMLLPLPLPLLGVEEPSQVEPPVLSPLDPRHLAAAAGNARRSEHLASLLVEARSVGGRLAALIVDTCRLVARIGKVPVPVAWTLAAFVLGVVVSRLIAAL